MFTIVTAPVVIVSLGAALLCLLVVLVVGSVDMRIGLYVGALYRKSTDRRIVALTFDDGPDPRQTPLVLDTLARHGAEATFFLVGEKAEAHPDIIRRMIAEGHLVGNHTYSHSSLFPLMGRKKRADELCRCDDAIEKIAGTKPTLFRPPFGVTNPPIARSITRGGYIVAGWDVRSLDTMTRTPREKILDRVCRRLRPGSVVLLHDDRPASDTLLDELLCRLEQNGYETTTFDKLFDLQIS